MLLRYIDWVQGTDLNVSQLFMYTCLYMQKRVSCIFSKVLVLLNLSFKKSLDLTFANLLTSNRYTCTCTQKYVSCIFSKVFVPLNYIENCAKVRYRDFWQIFVLLNYIGISYKPHEKLLGIQRVSIRPPKPSRYEPQLTQMGTNEQCT